MEGRGGEGGVILKVNDAVCFVKLISWSLKQHPEFFLFKMAVSESFFFTARWLVKEEERHRKWPSVMS